MSTSINDYVSQIHETAKEKGWWEKPREDGTILMLVNSELCEAFEEIRDGKPDCYVNHKPRSFGEISTGFTEVDPANPLQSVGELESHTAIMDNPKPEGTAVEVADAIIRLFDYAGFKGWNLEEIIQWKMKYNDTRAYRHGGKKF